jgi:hypothetical protein
MKGIHDIYIIQVGDTYRVRPAVWSSKGEKDPGNPWSPLRIRNLTDKKVLVVLPEILASGERAVFLAPKVDPPVAAPPNQDPPDIVTAKLKFKNKGDAPGVYPYSVIVYTGQGTTIAVGESDPVVIIDPPPA